MWEQIQTSHKQYIKGSFYASNITFIAEAYAEEDKALSLESYT